MLVLPIAFACPDDTEFKYALKKGIFDYMANPGASMLNIEELQDLTVLYLTGPTTGKDCTVLYGTYSGEKLSAIISKAEVLSQSTIPRCADGTYYGECSASKPKFCYSGTLRLMCSGPDTLPGNVDDCGCPIAVEKCLLDGSCEMSHIACVNDDECGPSGLIGTPYCEGNLVYGDFMNWICDNPGTPESSCSHTAEKRLLQTCPASCMDGACA